MTKPDEYSKLGLYGKKNVFEQRLKEGYTEIAFGIGDERSLAELLERWE